MLPSCCLIRLKRLAALGSATLEQAHHQLPLLLPGLLLRPPLSLVAPAAQ